METLVCTPQDTYVIVESIHTVITTARVGPTLRKVVRHVARTCAVQDIYYDGQRVTGMPSTFQYVMSALGLGDLTTRPNGEQRLMLAYAGFENLVRLLPQEFHAPPLPEEAFREYTLPRFGPFEYGRDPIPNVRLFGRPDIQFTSPGGDAPAAAVAIYDGATGQLRPVPPAMRRQALQQLLR
jgi:hypothetical protein